MSERISYYRGWNIFRGPSHPVTGTWRAERFGVEMGHNNVVSLKKMIDQRIADEEQRRKDRA